MRTAVSVIGALLLSGPAVADPVPKSPTDRWVVDFDDAQCVAMRLISPDDCPGVALDEDQGGTVSYALLIDEKGKVADCTVIDTSGVAALDAQSCAIIKAKAQFVPAVGQGGKTAKDATTGKVTWKIL